MQIITNKNDFIRSEFTGIELGDLRLSKRIEKIAIGLNESPTLSIPQLDSGSKSNSKGTYRFFQNKKINEQKILDSHRKKYPPKNGGLFWKNPSNQ